MLIELYLLLLILSFITFGIAYKNEVFPWNILWWSFTIILTSILAFQSLDIIQKSVVVSNQTVVGSFSSYEYKTIEDHTTSLPLMSFNLGVSGLALVFFFVDIFKWKQEKKDKR